MDLDASWQRAIRRRTNPPIFVALPTHPSPEGLLYFVLVCPRDTVDDIGEPPESKLNCNRDHLMSSGTVQYFLQNRKNNFKSIFNELLPSPIITLANPSVFIIKIIQYKITRINSSSQQNGTENSKVKLSGG